MKLYAITFLGMFFFACSSFAVEKKPSTILRFEDMKWETRSPGSPVKLVKLWGDPATGAHGRYIKMPPGYDPGIHAHSADYHGILISGTWMHWDEGQSEIVELRPGSYVMQPGNANHGDTCKLGAECVILLIQNDKADFIPVKKPVSKPTK